MRPKVIDFSEVLDDVVAKFAFNLYLEEMKTQCERVPGFHLLDMKEAEVLPPEEFPNRLCGRRTVKIVGGYSKFGISADTDVTARDNDDLSLIVSTRHFNRPFSDYSEQWRGDNHFFMVSVKETLITIANARLKAARNGIEFANNTTVVLECLAFMNAEPETIGTSYDELDQLLRQGEVLIEEAEEHEKLQRGLVWLDDASASK